MRVIRNQTFTTAADVGADAITCFGPGVTLIEDCVIDFTALPKNEQDEGISGVNGAKVTMRRCVLINCRKAILAGNGDHPDADAQGAEWLIEDCILIGCGRRCPEAQDGARVTMRRCWMHNWGRAFDVRAFGAWAHHGGRIVAEDCIFTQSGGLLSLGVLNAVRDIANHIGQAVNDGGLAALFKARTYLPGVCRGLTADAGGVVGAVRCYRNRPWIRIDGLASVMSEGESLELAARLVKGCPAHDAIPDPSEVFRWRRPLKKHLRSSYESQ